MSKLGQERKELQALDIDQLKEALMLFRKNLFSMRLHSSANHVKDYSQFRKLRRSIARATTILCQKTQ